MQPRFPADHHFHHHRPPAPARATKTDRAARYRQRQCLPAGDPTDPRAAGR